MKIAIVTTLYRDAVYRFYQQHERIADESLKEHTRLIDEKLSLWASAWKRALEKLGFEVVSIPVTATPLLSAWADEKGFLLDTNDEIVLAWLREFQPDILWYDSVDAALLKKIKNCFPALRLTIGWSGSAIVAYDVFREVDFVLSCAPETVTKLHADGLCIHHLHHAFDPLWLQHLQPAEKTYTLTFIGQFIRGKAFHTEREQQLRAIADKIELTIFSPTYSMGIKEVLYTFLTQVAYTAFYPIKKLGLSSSFMNIEKARKVLGLTQFPQFPYDKKLKRLMKPAVFGTEMLQQLTQSKIVLNIHADSSPRYASNMRLFETTGVSALLLTEKRMNLSEIFELDTEVITYENTEECIEKARWFSDHPQECRRISGEGQKRTLRDHTFDIRAQQFCDILNKYLSQKT